MYSAEGGGILQVKVLLPFYERKASAWMKGWVMLSLGPKKEEVKDRAGEERILIA